jgi:Outer membrane protein/protective antigen OMA87
VPNSYFDFVGQFGSYANSFPITAGWARDERDSGVSPTSGRYIRANTDFSLWGDVQYARLNGQVTQYSTSATTSRWASTPKSATAPA